MNQNELTLHMQNFRRFADKQLVTFSPGLTVISGTNGAGKSTLIEAKLYALFGPAKAGQQKDIRHDLSERQPVHVECYLTIDDQQIHVARSGAQAELNINGISQVKNGPGSGKEVTRRISGLLGGLTREQFERIYVALQGDTAGLVGESAPNKRRKAIETILHMDVLITAIELQTHQRDTQKTEVLTIGNILCTELALEDTARDLLQSFKRALTINSHAQYTQQFQSIIKQVITQQHQRMQEALQEASQKMQAVTVLKSQLQQAQKTVEQSKLTFAQLEKNQKRYQDFQQSITNIDGHVTQIKSDIQKHQFDIERAEQYTQAALAYQQSLNKIADSEKRLARLPIIRQHYDLYQDAQKKLSTIEQELARQGDLDQALRLAQDEQLQANQQWEALTGNDPAQNIYEEWHTQNAQLLLEIEQNQNSLQQLTSNTSTACCPTCLKPLDTHSAQEIIHHREHWLQETLPDLQATLQQKKRHVDTIKAQWEKDKKQAQRHTQNLQTQVHTIKTNLILRDKQISEREQATLQLVEKQQLWTALNENVPDPQETKNIRARIAQEQRHLQTLEPQVALYNQIPLLKTIIDNKEIECQNYEQQKQSIQKQQMQLDYKQEDFEKARIQLEQQRTQESHIQQQLYEAELHHASAQRSSSEAQQIFNNMQTQNNRFGQSVTEYMKEEHLLKYLDEFKKYFFEANTEEVMHRTTELLLYAITDQSILSVKFERDALTYFDGNDNYPIQRLSGGEKSLLGLCLRIALAEQAQAISRRGRVKFLVLDEVLSSLDEERCEAVQRIFANVLQRGIFEHIIMITHLDTVKQSWQAHGLTVHKLSDKKSKVTSTSPNGNHKEEVEEIGDQA